MNGYIIVGSVAGLKHRVIRGRRPLDTDIFATESGACKWMEDNDFEAVKTDSTKNGKTCWARDGRILEVELSEKCSNVSDILQRMSEDSLDGIHASPEWLYFLKMSHRFKKDSPHFKKTMKDILTMREYGVGMPKDSEDLFKKREALTYDYGHPKLNVMKGDFFKGDQVPYKYDHDSIHRVVAVDGTPAYTKYMKDGEQVMCSKEKFFEVDERVRLLGGLEEALVLTAERSLIPHDFKPNPHQMFEFALQKVCTSITSGWFREWCWDHYLDIMHLYYKEAGYGWVKKLRQGIANGTVLPYNADSEY